MNSKLEIINKIVEDISPFIRDENPILSLEGAEQALNEWSYENLIRLEFFMRRKTSFGKYIAEEGVEALFAFQMLIDVGENPEFDERDKADVSVTEPENNHENEEGTFLSIVIYKRDASYITGEIKARKAFEINQEIAATFKLDSFSVSYPLLCFENWTTTNLHDCGIYAFNPFAFYQDLNDEIDGSNLRMDVDKSYYMLAWDTDKVYAIIKQINALLPNFNSSENEKTKIKVIEERLSKYCESDTIVKFSLYFDA